MSDGLSFFDLHFFQILFLANFKTNDQDDHKVKQKAAVAHENIAKVWGQDATSIHTNQFRFHKFH